MNGGKYAYIVVWVKYAWEKSSCVSNIPLGEGNSFFLRNNRFRVPIQFPTNRFTFEKSPSLPPLLHPERYIGGVVHFAGN